MVGKIIKKLTQTTQDSQNYLVNGVQISKSDYAFPKNLNLEDLHGITYTNISLQTTPGILNSETSLYIIGNRQGKWYTRSEKEISDIVIKSATPESYTSRSERSSAEVLESIYHDYRYDSLQRLHQALDKGNGKIQVKKVK